MTSLAAQQLAEQRLQRPGDRPVDQLGEQRRQRVGQLLDDARPHVERRGVGHRPVRRRRGRGLGQRRDRPGLHDRERPARAGPLDVLRRAEPLLDPRAERGQRGRLGVVEHRPGAPLGRAPAALRVPLPVATVMHGLVRGGRATGSGRRAFSTTRSSVVTAAADHRLAEPPRGGDHDLVARARGGVRGEHDARRRRRRPSPARRPRARPRPGRSRAGRGRRWPAPSTATPSSRGRPPSSASSPRTLRNVSCWPAKLASSRSSAVADERTATAGPSSARAARQLAGERRREPAP